MVDKPSVKEMRKKLIEYFGKEWWNEVLKWLKENVDFPNLNELPEYLKDDFHEVFREKLASVFKITNEESAANRLVAYSRMDLLRNMRVPLLPHYFGILCPVFRSRSVNNFSLVTMKVDKKGDYFSRAFYNLPFPFDQKVKRTVISTYGLAKHGRKVDDLDKYPDGGVFLLNPDKDEKYEKFARYTDYSYVVLNWRFPKNYDEFIKTLDGSVLISRSAAEKLRYKRVAYAILRNPAPEISEKIWGILTKKIPKKDVRINYQQQLTDVDDETARLASVTGYISDVKLLTPQVKDPARRVWWIKIEDDRDVEIGCKLESPQGLKHSCMPYTPIFVRNKNGDIKLTSIEGLWHESVFVGTTPDGHEIAIPAEPIEVMTESGWTTIKKIIRHSVNKKIYRVRTLQHVVDVTEDHSLVIDGKEVKPTELSIDSKIDSVNLHFAEKYQLHPEIAWLYGFFLAEGTCIYKEKDSRYVVRIYNSDIKLLERAQKAFKLLNISSKITKASGWNGYILVIYRKEIVKMLRDKFYDYAGNKTIPIEILHGDTITKEKFIEGYIDGDGYRVNGRITITSKSQILTAGLKEILNDLGYSVRIHLTGNGVLKKQFYQITIRDPTHQNSQVNTDCVRELTSWNYTGYVYDLETENHHFSGGIGNVLLHNTVAGYTDDEEPTIVLNPDTFKDRAIWREIKETGYIHCYPTIPGMDGNISNRNIRISRTLVQGIFCYPPKVQEKLIEAIFNKDNLTFPYPKEILKILENMPKVDPDKLMKKYPVFFNHFYYLRRKQVGDTIYFYEEPTKVYRAWKKLNKVKDFDKLSRFDRESLNQFVRQIIKKMLLFDSEKKCQIKIKGYIRIILFHSEPDPNVAIIGKDLWMELGEPGYILFAKEPVTRDLSIRCLKVKVKKDVPPWVIYIHPYLAMNHETGEFHTKIDTDGDLGLIIPLKEPIKEAMYSESKIVYDKLWNENKDVTIDTVKHFKPYENLYDFLIDVYEYNRRESIEQLIMQSFGGVKNRAMFTPIIEDWKEWKKFVETWDLELKGFQAEKLNPELKDATPQELNEFYTRMLKEALTAKIPDYIEEYKQLRELENITYKDIPKVRKVLKSLKKSKHPVIKLMARIYETLEII